MSHLTDDLRIRERHPLLPPAILMEELPLTDEAAGVVARARREIAAILAGTDDRLVVVVGPCSLHEPIAGLDYARHLAEAAQRLKRDLLLVMRVYFEKPRTRVGWKGLINDPHLNHTFAINDGLRIARRFLLDVTCLGLPAGTEFLDPITPQFLADAVSWGAIGARTVESQVHRELASGLSMPVGFKNGTDGSIRIAIDAVCASSNPHHFLGVTKQGLAAILATRGNRECHIILRGGSHGPNHSDHDLAQVAATLEDAGLPRRVMVDCSHANSGKDPRRQPGVAGDLARRIAAGDRILFGVMLESFLVAGRQDIGTGQNLVYGQSITDGCLDWESTLPVLEELARAARARRSHVKRDAAAR